MKSKSLLIFLLGCSKMLVGQDSLTVETVQDSAFVAPQYSSVYDDVFMNKKETKWLFKVDALGLVNLTGGYSLGRIPSFHAINSKFKVDFEHKLFSNLSINYSAGVIFNNNKYQVKSVDEYVVGIEPRWYFKSRKNAKMIQNLNGNYISLNYTNAINDLIKKNESNISKTLDWAVVTSYGIQKRIFNNGYIDYQVGFGIGRNNLTDNIRFRSLDLNYWLHNNFTLGLAFGGGKKSQTNTCDLFRCYEEEKNLWKLDIRNIYKNSGDDIYTISINSEFEHKIKKSSFSINTGIELNYKRYYHFDLEYGVKGTIEPRYYYNLKKRIAQGKTANNLSGGYFSLEFSSGYSEYVNGRNTFSTNMASDTFKKFETKTTFYAIEPKWGIQKRLFKNGFMDLSFSLIRFRKSFVTDESQSINGIVTKKAGYNPFQNEFEFLNPNSSIPLPNMYFKIGFAF
jgi:hypothetical protein